MCEQGARRWRQRPAGGHRLTAGYGHCPGSPVTGLRDAVYTYKCWRAIGVREDTAVVPIDATARLRLHTRIVSDVVVETASR